ncbi:DoxX family protein [Faecalibacter rhinopitheci]|uniref:DoxX family protein n=1 Tax=Faecalibacter rhinopitheci TaxID=2779678 RepID=A0A8J7G5V4_9FLAO|nr:DoxX family protein [Faecalibacter rhinopitheci]MBF0597272.1 DoxX family protein [Faecalibacter rhinopitheci]
MTSKFSLKGNQPAFINLSLLLIRLSAGGFMLTHGWGKLIKLINGNFEFGDPIGLGVEISLGLAVFAEIFCSLLIVFGFFTRLASIPLIITMLVAVFVVHLDHDFGKKELGLFYFINYLVLFLSGAGKFSMDYLLRKK